MPMFHTRCRGVQPVTRPTLRGDHIHMRGLLLQCGSRFSSSTVGLQFRQNAHRQVLDNLITNSLLCSLFQMSLRVELSDMSSLELLGRHGRLFLDRLGV